MSLIEYLRQSASDPMWADHAEVNKRVLTAAADEIENLRRILRSVRRAMELSMAHSTKTDWHGFITDIETALHVKKE